MRTSLARLFLGWLLMLAGGCLLIESGLQAPRADRMLLAAGSLAGFGLFVAGVWLRRSAVRQPR